MNSNPLISIITPAFNASATVAQAIESVMAQTYSNWELLIVDDASTDSTAAIVSDYAARESRIKLIQLKENTGLPGRAKNAALPKAAGEFLAFIDADDLWLKEKLAIQISMIVASGADLCFTGGWYVDEALELKGEFSPQHREGWLFDQLLAQYNINNQTVILKRSALVALDAPHFNPDITIGEDCDLFMRIARTGKILSLPDKLIYYRLRKDSISMGRINHLDEGLSEVIRWTETDPTLVQRCSRSLRFARAKSAFYKAKIAMIQDNQLGAFSLLCPVMFVSWRYTVLTLSTLAPPVWRYLLSFSVR
jgi:teichuronic acid biosynthesis glycosyltransferase TuaG